MKMEFILSGSFCSSADLSMNGLQLIHRCIFICIITQDQITLLSYIAIEPYIASNWWSLDVDFGQLRPFP